MRIALMIVTGTTLLTAASVSTASARVEAYPYCAVAGGNQGYENCHYPGLGACLAAVNAVGGYCQPNPRFVGYYDVRGEQPLRRKSRRPR
jgi:hypothetical protein